VDVTDMSIKKRINLRELSLLQKISLPIIKDLQVFPSF